MEKLPLVLVVANNQYAYSTPTARQFACDDLVDKAIGYGVQRPFGGRKRFGGVSESVGRSGRARAAAATGRNWWWHDCCGCAATANMTIRIIWIRN